MSALLDIFNRTLYRVGIHDNLATTSDDVPRADVLNVHWAGVRKEFLEKRPWSWARASLNPLVLTSTQLDPLPLGYLFQYDIPSAALKIRHINPRESDIEYELWTNGTTRYLMTDYALSDIELVYTHDLTDVTMWPEEAITAVVLLLAMQCETVLAEDDRFFERNARMFAFAMDQASVGARIEENQSKPRANSLLNARKGTGV